MSNIYKDKAGLFTKEQADAFEYSSDVGERFSGSHVTLETRNKRLESVPVKIVRCESRFVAGSHAKNLGFGQH